MVLIKTPLLLLASIGIAFVASITLPSTAYAEHSLAGRQNNRNGRNGNNNGGTNKNGGSNGGNNNNGNNALELNPQNVQDASKTTGQENGAEPGQSPSRTDPANFINFCTGKTLTNGLQGRSGSCNGIVMGDLPAANNMVSSIIISPKPGEDIPANKAFTITVQVNNLQAGSFTNPDTTYYAAPQALASNGKVIGHSHVTIQNLGSSLTPSTPPNADNFVFFKGINDVGNGQGLLSAQVTKGLPAGFYRVCTMNSASNHQPVIMPVAQRGAQDDCTKFTIGQGGGNNNSGGGNNNKGPNGQNGKNGQNGQNKGGAAGRPPQAGRGRFRRILRLRS